MWTAVCDGSLSESKTADRCSTGLSRDDDASLKNPAAAAAAASRRDARSTMSDTTLTLVHSRSQQVLSALLPRELRLTASLLPLSNAHPGSTSVTWSVGTITHYVIIVDVAVAETCAVDAIKLNRRIGFRKHYFYWKLSKKTAWGIRYRSGRCTEDPACFWTLDNLGKTIEGLSQNKINFILL